MTAQEWVNKQELNRNKLVEKGEDLVKVLKFPNLQCNDGMVLSVQASPYHLCNYNRKKKEYDSVEIFIGDRDIPEFGLDIDPNDNNIASYVPMENLQKFVDNHGGIKE